MNFRTVKSQYLFLYLNAEDQVPDYIKFLSKLIDDNYICQCQHYEQKLSKLLINEGSDYEDDFDNCMKSELSQMSGFDQFTYLLVLRKTCIEQMCKIGNYNCIDSFDNFLRWINDYLNSDTLNDAVNSDPKFIEFCEKYNKNNKYIFAGLCTFLLASFALIIILKK